MAPGEDGGSPLCMELTDRVRCLTSALFFDRFYFFPDPLIHLYRWTKGVRCWTKLKKARIQPPVARAAVSFASPRGMLRTRIEVHQHGLRFSIEFNEESRGFFSAPLCCTSSPSLWVLCGGKRLRRRGLSRLDAAGLTTEHRCGINQYHNVCLARLSNRCGRNKASGCGSSVRGMATTLVTGAGSSERFCPLHWTRQSCATGQAS